VREGFEPGFHFEEGNKAGGQLQQGEGEDEAEARGRGMQGEMEGRRGRRTETCSDDLPQLQREFRRQLVRPHRVCEHLPCQHAFPLPQEL
jgi:hypothetical protein